MEGAPSSSSTNTEGDTLIQMLEAPGPLRQRFNAQRVTLYWTRELHAVSAAGVGAMQFRSMGRVRSHAERFGRSSATVVMRNGLLQPVGRSVRDITLIRVDDETGDERRISVIPFEVEVEWQENVAVLNGRHELSGTFRNVPQPRREYISGDAYNSEMDLVENSEYRTTIPVDYDSDDLVDTAAPDRASDGYDSNDTETVLGDSDYEDYDVEYDDGFLDSD